MRRIRGGIKRKSASIPVHRKYIFEKVKPGSGVSEGIGNEHCFDLGEQLDDPATLCGEVHDHTVGLAGRRHAEESLRTEPVDLLPGVGVPRDVLVDLGFVAARMLANEEQDVSGVGGLQELPDSRTAHAGTSRST